MSTSQQRAVYEFYTQNIKSTIGLRGFSLQLRVEKAATLDELRQLRDPFVEAVQKAKGRDKAALLAQQLDALLNDPD
ncbi:tRNA uridine 5-carbamoylmethylation protein Kti12 [Duganella sp. 1224]|uniref:hypothetical protein n=1 Tax=Duganella sp. 1224 TaxID=2587052 RepID=UPI0015C8DD63|nr:hypothetical protein [Duganella sp. 1224]NYE63430.1 tRNA uridine 5-carbamoylmethylation protein Kti12 [Duganella sp. 1224]